MENGAPSASVTVALDELPSPQSIIPACVSRMPGSVKPALTVTSVPTS